MKRSRATRNSASPGAARPDSRLRLRVTPDAERQIRSGHPWLFARSVREQNREGNSGELAVIYDRRDTFLGIGLFDPDSELRVRLLHAGKPQTIDLGWWRSRLERAIEGRRGLFDERTTGGRLINGESDGWPGLVLDRYDGTLVLKLYTAAWLPRLGEIASLISGMWPALSRVGKSVPTGDTRLRLSDHPEPRAAAATLLLRLSRNIQTVAQTKFNVRDSDLLTGQRPDGCPIFLESGLRFEADVLRGQKTGFFLDQRENRRRIEALAGGRDVLNAFSFTGGFSVYAARGGARHVTDLDISAHALRGAERNFALNELHAKGAQCPHETIQADAFEWLAGNRARLFDLVILDPPSLAKRESERGRGIQAYGRLAAAGMAHLRAGGILVAASCSAHVSADEFFDAVRHAAKRSGKTFVEMETTGHPADHPATFPEAHYLKCILLQC